MGKTSGWAGVPTGPGVRGCSSSAHPSQAHGLESHILDGVQGGRGPGPCPPKRVYRDISLGGVRVRR